MPLTISLGGKSVDAIIEPCLSKSTLSRNLCTYLFTADQTHHSCSVVTPIGNCKVETVVQFVLTNDNYCRLGRDWFSDCCLAAVQVGIEVEMNIDTFDPGFYYVDQIPDNHTLLINEIMDMFCDPFSPFNFLGDDAFKATAELHGFVIGTCVDRLCLAHHILYGHCSFGKGTECRRLAGPATGVEIRKGIATALSSIDVSTNQLSFMCKSVGIDKKTVIRKNLLNPLKSLLAESEFKTADSIMFINSPTQLKRVDLLRIASHHGLSLSGSVENLFTLTSDHIFHGGCLKSKTFAGCSNTCLDLALPDNTDSELYTYRLFKRVVPKLRIEGAKRFLSAFNLPFNLNDSIYVLRDIALQHAQTLVKEENLSVPWQPAASNKLKDKLTKLRELWPQRVSDERKEELIKLFHEHTSSLMLKRMVCGCCSRDQYADGVQTILLSTLNVDLLKFPLPSSVDSESDVDESELEEDSNFVNRDSQPSNARLDALGCDDQWDAVRDNFKHFLPFKSGPLRNFMLDPEGVTTKADGSIYSQICNECLGSLRRNKLPKFALANRLFIGEVPGVLNDLTQIEESMIALCRAKNWIVRLPGGAEEQSSPDKQRGMRGHTIIYPQDPGPIASLLPPSVEDIVTPICVLFVGSKRPSVEWLKKHAKPLIARADRVRAALIWLKENNPLYKSITINEGALKEIENMDMLPFQFESVDSTMSQEHLTARYDDPAVPMDVDSPEDAETVFERVVVSNVEGIESSRELRAAAMKHMSASDKSHVRLPHHPTPVNEFDNPALLPMIYPTLFPYGLGGLEDKARRIPVSFKAHAQYLFLLKDQRFKVHPTFMFTVFNIIQRRALLLQTSLKVKRSKFSSVARRFGTVSLDCVQRMSERVRNGDTKTARDEEERRVLELMKHVSVITSHAPGSAGARLEMRNEIRGLMTHLGMPTFFVTINPADIFNPVVKFLAGDDIDVDSLKADQVPDGWKQSLLIANNPVAPVEFFQKYMKAFVDCLLKYDGKSSDVETGVLGVTAGYYGCIEAQGRGSLHCHMLIWVHGALNPNEIKERVLQDGGELLKSRIVTFLDDVISTSVPDCPSPVPDVPSSHVHPCSIRGLNNLVDDTVENRAMDLHNVAKACQKHVHSATCYKYSKPGQEKECRFDLYEEKFVEKTTFDEKTGEITLKCLNGMVNNFNAAILRALRCNMDIKFIGSGATAKAALYYITDYITKGQLKAHVAFAALEHAVSRLREYHSRDSDISARAKALIQKCAHAMIAQQELSSQQVCNHLLGFEDKITSHRFRKFYWTTFEKYIDKQRPLSAPTLDDDAEDDGDNLAECDNYVEIEQDENGQLREKSSVLYDYINRGPELNGINLWDFVGQIDKIKRKDDDNDMQFTSADITDWEAALLDRRSERPKFRLHGGHQDFDTHYHRLRADQNRFVVVPVGPALPRRDNQEYYERYCRLMLIFFAPWRDVTDLASSEEKWESAFVNATNNGHLSSLRIQKLMDNMQVLHECKDSRDEYWANRHMRSKMNRIPAEFSAGGDASPEFVYDDDTFEEMMEFIDRVDKSKSVESKDEADIAECLFNAKAGGIIPHGGTYMNSTDAEDPTLVKNITDKDRTLEMKWKTAYEKRRLEGKHRLRLNENEDPTGDFLPSAIENNEMDGIESHERVPVPFVETNDASMEMDIETFAKKWSLNREQSLAFKIMAGKASDSGGTGTEPLRMFINGAAGTGKSRVINALTDFFASRNEQRRLRICSYMGIAARNVSGCTLHSALNLSSHRKKDGSFSKELREQWDGVDFLVVDEVSMLSCRMLYQISNGLSGAKGNTDAFGGMNVIFAGDFAQLPPIGDTRLYGKVQTDKECKSKSGQDVIFGKLLWLSVDTVVTLKQQHRQSGDDNESFVELLGRVREGAGSSPDYRVLLSRLLTSAEVMNETDWSDATVIVCNNAVKDALNEKMAVAFANKTGQELHWYYSQDRMSTGKAREYVSVETSPLLQEKLWSVHSGTTNQRLGRLPLVIGMPVIVSQNFDVVGGIVNGSRGILKGIRYTLGPENRRYLQSCIVEINDASDSCMPDLPANHYPIIADNTTFQYKHPFSGEKRSFTRTQVPVLPAFCITAHRAQGQTMDKIAIDLQGCRGTEAPYVMLSRSRDLKKVAILRSFDINKIKCGMSEDRRLEIKRLQVLEHLTWKRHGNPDDIVAAEDNLRRFSTVFEQSVLSVPENRIKGDPVARLATVQTLLESSSASMPRMQKTALTSAMSAPKRKSSDIDNAPRDLKRLRTD